MKKVTVIKKHIRLNKYQIVEKVGTVTVIWSDLFNSLELAQNALKRSK